MTSTVFTNQFDYEPKTHAFVAEMSCLEHAGFRFGQVYGDSCDESLTLVSTKTGKEVRYAVERVFTNEGDIVSWNLTPVPADLRKVPAARGTKVVIIND